MLWTVDCAWVQLIGDDLFNIIINTSLFSLSFTLLLPSAFTLKYSVIFINYTVEPFLLLLIESGVIIRLLSYYFYYLYYHISILHCSNYVSCFVISVVPMLSCMV